MKKQSILTLALISTLALNSQAQIFKTSVSLEDAPKKAITHVSADKLGSDDYDITVYLAASQEVIDKYETYYIEETIYINGQVASKEQLRTSYEKSSDAGSDEQLISPSITLDLYLQNLIQLNGNLVKEKGNKLKIDFYYEKDKSALGSCEITFDVPGFNKFDSDFCKLLKMRNTDKKVEATLHAMFKSMYPHDEIVETLCYREWTDFKDYDGNPEGESVTYMLIFKYKGTLWKLQYDASYVLEDGVILDKPRVKIYNGLDDPEPINPSCLKALQATFN